ncbi:ankyrin repeat-containing protein ITN1 [Prunus persica]|uniref:ankyrin repeat-containing protein ITN1 n=1 Tax=Prunus persica TaxID=3760 RepID=UPI0009AB54C6|nr:ankyrin repeat-containing protein ITN1 [Prunus persica]
MRLGHDRILQILRLMCDVVKHTNLDWKQTIFVQKAILRAVEGGKVEFIKEMCKANPRILLTKMDERGRSIFLYAVECRQEKVFNLIYGLSEYDRNAILTRADDFNNTILHAAGSLSGHLNHIQGAALQMQRELQWFKEVESIVPPSSLEMINVTEKMTAQEVFTKNHKELVKEGEESIKGIATSCTVVGALIVTIMFAAAFTVPGGSNQDTGFQSARLCGCNSPSFLTFSCLPMEKEYLTRNAKPGNKILIMRCDVYLLMSYDVRFLLCHTFNKFL